jgi:uncharacterized phiE125 gp8 family phage protein
MVLPQRQDGTYTIVNQSTYDSLVASVAEVKSQLNISHSSDDTLIGILILTAQGYIQDYTGLYINEQDIKYSCPLWPEDGVMWLTKGPFTDAAELVLKYYNSSNTEVTMVAGTDYTAFVVNDNLRIQLLNQPTVIDTRYDAINATVQMGWASNSIPKYIKQAVIIMAAHLYNNRDIVIVGASVSEELPYHLSAILAMYKRMTI